MGFFDFLKSNKNKTTEIEIDTNNDDTEDDSKSKIGASVAIESSVRSSTAKASVEYSKPSYNPQTRKQFYDNGSAHKQALDNAFAGGETVRDPYTNAELFKKQSDAKLKYGNDYQNHSAEADHIDPLGKFFKRVKNNPFLKTKDINEIGNAEDNFQVISRKLNQGSKEVGKGRSTQNEWADDPIRMDGLADLIESGESIESVKQRIRDTGNAAEKRNDRRAFQKSIVNAAKTAHEAGIAGAQNAGITSLTMSGIMNVVSVIKGEKSTDDAIDDTLRDGGNAALTGYALGGGLTVVTHTLSYNSSEFIRSLAENNVPSKVITAVMVTGDTLKKWGDGEITTQECLIQLGDKGLNMATIGYSYGVGQALIPFPVIGGAVGALVGSILTSNLYNNLINDLQTKQLEHEERLRIIEECNAAAEQSRAFREELESYIESYFEDYRSCFDTALSTIKLSYSTGDVDGVISGANSITKKLGGNVKFETLDEFKSFLDSDEDDCL